MHSSSILARGLSMLFGLALIAVGAYLNVYDLGHRYGFLSPDCLFVYGLAAGTAAAAIITVWQWHCGRIALAVAIMAGVLMGEAFGFYTTAERLLFVRSDRIVKVNDSNAPRLAADEAVRRAAADLDVAKAKTAEARSDKRCGDVCRAWEAAEEKARERLATAEYTRSTMGTARDPSPLATALGISPTVADIVPALLGSAALMILGFALIAAGGHTPVVKQPEPPARNVEAFQSARDRREAAIARINEMTEENGGRKPPFHVIKNELNLPNATASRYRRLAGGQ